MRGSENMPSYGYNFQVIVVAGGGLISGTRDNVSEGDIELPAETIFLYDAAGSPNNNPTSLKKVEGTKGPWSIAVFLSPAQDSGRPTGATAVPQSTTFHGRHNGVGTIIWMDGHANSRRPDYRPDGTAPETDGRK